MTIRFDSLGLALGTVALICLGCGEPVAPPTVSEEVAAEIQKEEKAAEEAANQSPEEEYELKEAGVGATGKGNYGVTSEEAASIITVPISTYFHAQEKAVFDIQIPQALSLFQASEGRFPNSEEEFMQKIQRGRCDDPNRNYSEDVFDQFDCNEIFDNGILTYRDVRAENFSLESEEQRRQRVEKTLTEILTQCSPFDVTAEFFIGKLEVFLTCRALAEEFNVKIGSRSAEEYALVWIHQLLQKARVTYADLQLFLNVLPEILARPFLLCKKLNQFVREKIFPVIYRDLAAATEWSGFCDYNYIHRLLNAIK